MTKLQDKLFFAVRKTNDKEWVDGSTGGRHAQTSINYAEINDRKVPIWAKEHPVIRFAQFKLTELV